MKIGYMPYRALLAGYEDSLFHARDFEARDEADAWTQANEAVVAPNRVARIVPLDPDEVRTYSVQIAPKQFPFLRMEMRVKAKSSVEAAQIAQIDVESGIVPLSPMFSGELGFSARPLN